MRTKVVLSLLLLQAAQAADRQILYTGMTLCGGCISPTFDHGYLFQMTGGGAAPSTGLAMYTPDGQPAYQINVHAPDGTPAYLRQEGLTADTDGTALLPYWYGGYGGNAPVKGGGIAFIDLEGRQTQFIDTGLYLPDAVCFAPDHSVWMAGTPLRPHDYQIVRHYSRDGHQLGAFLPRASFPKGLAPTASGMSWMRAAADRIGIMTFPGQVSDTPTWVEVDFEGKELGRWQVPSKGLNVVENGWAFTSDARLFALPRLETQRTLTLFNRATSSWQPVMVGPVNSLLMGFDGDNLVFEPCDYSNGVQLVRLPIPPTQ